MTTGGGVESACKAYETWGASRAFLDDVKSAGFVTLSALNEFLFSIESDIAQTDHRLLPFAQSDGSVHAFPRARAWAWGTLERALRNAGARSVMSMLPPLWQMEPLVFAACREAGAPLFIVEPDNFAVAARAIDTAGIDSVIAATAAAQDLARDLAAHGDAHPDTWFIIGLPGDTPAAESVFASSARVISEIHLIPGVPLFVQCEHLRSAPLGARYHCADELDLALEHGRALVSTCDANLMPLHRVELPMAIQEAGACACGKTIITL